MSFLDLFVSRPQTQKKATLRSAKAKYRLSMETLEDRTVPAGLVWVNRGLNSDHFADAFGVFANQARGVVDSALAEWNRVVVGFQGESFETELTIAMDPDNPGLYASAHDTHRDGNGVPTSGQITINMGIDEDTGLSKWFLDPTPDLHEEFQGDLVHAFARKPTPGGPADGLRDLRTLLIHEIGHTMGISVGSKLLYENPNPAVTTVNTNIADTSTNVVGDKYWLFSGPNVRSLMTNYDILAEDFGKAGHNAMPRTNNVPVNYNSKTIYTAVDTMQPTSLSIQRVLLTKKTALMLGDMGYDVVPPEFHNTFHAFLDGNGILKVRGGNDNTKINNINQGVSSDNFVISTNGSIVIVSVDVGVDVPGTGSNLTVKDQQGAFSSWFNISDVHGISVQGLGGNDTITFLGNFNNLEGNITVNGGEGNDVINAFGMSNHGIVAYGDNGYDTIWGSDDHDVLYGNVGADIIHGEAGNDTIVGGSLILNAGQVVPDSGDQLYGDGGQDALYGDNIDLYGVATPVGGGNDTMRGGLGNDTINGGIGNDSLYGDAGDDHLIGMWGNDLLSGGTDDDVLTGADGDDTLQGDAGNDSLHGNVGNDTLYGDEGNDTLQGDAGNDKLYGQDDNDTLYGDEGNDELSGGAGNDLLLGYEGNDSLSGGNGDDFLFGGLGNDTLFGNVGNDYLSGETGNDTLYGNEGADTVYGGSGVDYIVGGSIILNPNANIPGDGDDQLDGDAGNDTLFGDNVLSGTFYPVGFGNDTMHGGGDNDKLYGGMGNDHLFGDSGTDQLYGLWGNDTLNGGTENDTLYGGDQNDQLIGGMGADLIYGGEGDDNLIGGTSLEDDQDGSNDQLFGENGNDTLLGDNFAFGASVAAGNDTLNGGAGDDNLYGQDGNDTLSGGIGDDYLRGGDGNDQLQGGLGNDDLGGEDGNDTLQGETGVDQLHGGNGNDNLYGGLGDDSLWGDADNDNLYGESGNDQLNGGNGEDNLYGGIGDDALDGGDDDDLLLGQDGVDTLNGNTGNDMIRGGAGNDNINGGDGDDLLLGEAGRDGMVGGLGRDVLIGGRDADRMVGGDGDDILIGGVTSYDNNDTALIAIFSEWRSAKDQASRVSNLRSIANPTFNLRLNGKYYLRKGVEVFDDGSANILTGANQTDWFFYSKATDTTDKVDGEIEN